MSLSIRQEQLAARAGVFTTDACVCLCVCAADVRVCVAVRGACQSVPPPVEVQV
jgi:hypothetical protein